MNTAPKASLGVRLTGGALLVLMFAFVTAWLFAAIMLKAFAAAQLGLALFGLLIVAGVVAWWRKLRLLESWRSIAVTATAFGALLAWLAWDEPQFNELVSIEQLSPAPADAEQSYQATLLYTQRPDAKAPPARMPESKFSLKTRSGDKTEAVHKAIAAARAQIAAEWNLLKAERDWLARLDGFAAIGDAQTVDYETPIINLSVVRRVVQIGCYEAVALALEGKGDEALATLRPLASVSLKLERHARTEIRVLSGFRNLDLVLGAAQEVLSLTPASATERAAFAAVLEPRDVKSIAHRLAWLPYHAAFFNLISKPGGVFEVIANEMGIQQGWLVGIASCARPVVFLPKASANYLARWSAAAEKIILDPDSKAADEDTHQLLVELVSPPVKNFGGRAIMSIAMPNYQSWGKRLRASEDARQALLKTLRNP